MNKLIYLVIFSFFSTGIYAQMKDLVQYVNTLQGTDSHFGLSYGNTYPTTGMPYAMHTWSAQTGKNGEGWKYQYAVDNIRGFCQSHQCSPWMSDYAVYSFMPMVGKLVVNQEMRATKFSHDNEIAKPHYYKVMLDNGITTEMAPTTRGVHLRFSYPSTEDAYLVIDGYTDMSEIKIDPAKRQISGWVNNQRFVNNSKTFRSYFVVQFDKAFEDYGMWENQKDEIFPKKLEGEGKGYGAYIKFKKGSKVQAKAASSYISAEQAVITLNDELGKDKNLEATKIRGHKTWNELLNRIQVEGGTDEQMKTFYSCLFRANLFSRKFYERKANGEPYYYSPYDGKVYDGYMYTDNGFWDTFRSQFPLTNILHPTMQGRYMNALLAAQEQCGWLPSWSAPGETGGMLGNHSISLLADAWAKGIRTFDPETALKAYAHAAMNKGPWGGANGRGFSKEYFELGYVPYPESMGSSAQTMEYAYDDFCGYQLAKMTGNKHYQEVFARQMYNYKNVFDPSIGFMRGKGVDGKWQEPFDPLEWGGPFCEGNAWHYTWSVFHDVEGLIDLYYDYDLVVVGTRHAAHIKEHVPEWWGIITVEQVGDQVDFYMLREPQSNPQMDWNCKIEILWRPELAHIQELNAMHAYKQKSKRFVADKIVETVPKETLAVQLSEELFERDYTKIWETIQNFRKENGQKLRRRRRRRKTKKQA